MQNVRPQGQEPANRVLTSNLFLYSMIVSLNLESGKEERRR